jgi:glycerol-3-phosphate acyltransferase PlsX
MGSVYATAAFGIASPRVGLLSIGEESSKGNTFVKETHPLLAAAAEVDGIRFVGNVEGRDVMSDRVDVVVTDGFTGNVVLKTLEGGMKTLVGALLAAFGSAPQYQSAADTLLPALLPLYSTLDPENTGGALLLGVDGVCLISHGSSSATAIFNACRTAGELVEADLVAKLRRSVS